MTRSEFVEKHRAETAGTIALGHARARIVLVGCFNGNTAEKFLAELDETVTVFLRRLYDSLHPPTNGQAQHLVNNLKRGK